jgi:hypothetical protein
MEPGRRLDNRAAVDRSRGLGPRAAARTRLTQTATWRWAPGKWASTQAVLHVLRSDCQQTISSARLLWVTHTPTVCVSCPRISRTDLALSLCDQSAIAMELGLVKSALDDEKSLQNYAPLRQSKTRAGGCARSSPVEAPSPHAGSCRRVVNCSIHERLCPSIDIVATSGDRFFQGRFSIWFKVVLQAKRFLVKNFRKLLPHMLRQRVAVTPYIPKV